ncbi:MAG: zinc-dependent metalloprotease, partial [Xanthomonadales bacterium]|nr:zinc-dependent metalloprotease [Xanthomonadales bacterium]
TLLLVSALPGSLGSNEVGLDRNQLSSPRLVSFRRVGERLALIQHNTAFTARSSDAAERAAVTAAFAESVLWTGDVQGQREDRVIVDLSSLLVLDLHGAATSLKAAEQGDHALDAQRSLALPEAAHSFPDNAEFEALLTFAGAGESPLLQQIVPDARSLTLRQRLSFVRLPEPGFEARPFHPASGAYSISQVNFAQPLSAPLGQHWQPRFRLQATDPTAERSRAVKPIVFLLDRGTPEPMRSALLEGGNWWQRAFEAAGWIDAYRVELQPESADLLDLRHNAITWTHRATRGWSYGGGIIDPRTGEIIKGFVNLGSQRVRQDLLIAEVLLAPYGQPEEAALLQQAQAMALARLRQLSAHEIGHALGLAHNFAASLQGNGSVMDYPHPLISLKGEQISLADAYGVGVGEWDLFAIRHGYQRFAADALAAGQAALRADIRAAGFDYVSDADARAPGDAHPTGLLWDFGGDTLGSWQRLLAVRGLALRRFGAGVLPPDRQAGELEARLVPLYLLHRYQAEAVARQLGGVEYRQGLMADARPAQAVPPEAQRVALQALLQGISVDTLTLPAGIAAQLLPPAVQYQRNAEYFDSRSLPLFDPDAAVGAATLLISQFLLQPDRLNRMHWQHARDARQPDAVTAIDALLQASWRQEASAAQQAVAWARNWVVLDSLYATLDSPRLQPVVAAQLRAALVQLHASAQRRRNDDRSGAQFAQAADEIARYLQDPASLPRRSLPRIPPGSPI